MFQYRSAATDYKNRIVLEFSELTAELSGLTDDTDSFLAVSPVEDDYVFLQCILNKRGGYLVMASVSRGWNHYVKYRVEHCDLKTATGFFRDFMRNRLCFDQWEDVTTEYLVTMRQVENYYHFTYPWRFREIERTGAMRWLGTYYYGDLDPVHSFFFEEAVRPFWTPLHFGEVGGCRSAVLEDMKGKNERLKERYQIIPFAVENEGDVYLFCDAGDGEEPFIACWLKDARELVKTSACFDDFLFLCLASCILDFGMDFSSELLQAQVEFLKGEYRAIFCAKDRAAVEELRQRLSLCTKIDAVEA